MEDAADLAWAETLALLDQDPRGEFNAAHEICGRWAAAEPDRVALTVVEDDGQFRRWTYGELDRLSRACATVLLDLGLRPGDRVAALLSRQVESVVVALATWGSGMVYVPLYCGLGADALRERLVGSDARLVVVDQRWSTALDAAVAALPEPPATLTVGGEADTLWKRMASREPQATLHRTRGTDTATLMFTSGTTGPAKACAMPHHGLASLVPFVRHGLGLVPGESRLFTTADPGWSYGLYTTGVVPMALGIERVIYRGDFDARAWLEVVRDHEVTALASAPSAYRRLAPALRDVGALPSLTTAAAGGEPLLAETAAAWQDAGGPPIHDAYGLSEVGMVLGDTVSPPSGTRPGTLAGPVPGFDVRLVDASGADVPAGTPGRIAITRPPFQLASGYATHPAAWSARWAGDLFLTEDMAVTEPDGRWRFIGRTDDMIITKGFNVSPVEVETAIASLPAVVEVGVVPIDVPGRGTLVRAVLVVAEGHDPGEPLERLVRETVTTRVARYAAPAVVDYVSELPRNEAGKLRRAALRTDALAEPTS